MFTIGRKAKKKRDGDRKQELKKQLLEQAKSTRPSQGAQIAIAYCLNSIDEYEDYFDWNELRWVCWQQVVLIGGAVATLSGVITIPHSWLWWLSDPHSFAWLRGVPAAIVTIAAGYMSSFTYREDAVRHEVTAETLLIELVKFVGKAEPYNAEKENADTSAFLNTVCLLIETESRSWSALVSKASEENKATTGKDIKKDQPPPAYTPPVSASALPPQQAT